MGTYIWLTGLGVISVGLWIEYILHQQQLCRLNARLDEIGQELEASLTPSFDFNRYKRAAQKLHEIVKEKTLISIIFRN